MFFFTKNELTSDRVPRSTPSRRERQSWPPTLGPACCVAPVGLSKLKEPRLGEAREVCVDYDGVRQQPDRWEWAFPPEVMKVPTVRLPGSWAESCQRDKGRGA